MTLSKLRGQRTFHEHQNQIDIVQLTPSSCAASVDSYELAHCSTLRNFYASCSTEVLRRRIGMAMVRSSDET